MYSKDNITKGKELLGLTNNELIWDIIIPNIDNFLYFHEQKQYRERFNVSRELSKKQLKEKIKEINKFIDYYRDLIRQTDGGFGQEQLDQYIKLKERLNLPKKLGDNKADIKKAREFPINQLLQFKKNGFTDCVFHSTGKQNTPSLHLDKRRNKAHCFSCGKDVDSIDIYMQLYKVSLTEAIKKLS